MKALLVAGIVALAGEKVEGRVRLQKIVYLLQRMGFDLGYDDFMIYAYGPFSEELAATLDAAAQTHLLLEEEKEGTDHTAALGHPTYTYRVPPEQADFVRRVPSAVFGERTTQLKQALDMLTKQPRAVLEVAATKVFLQHEAGLQGEQLDAKLRELKGHLASHFDNANKLLAELEPFLASPACGQSPN